MINSIKKLKKINAKKVLLRLDLNVQIKDGKILDDYRLEAAKETIEFLLKKKAKLIIISHLGKAEGKRDEKYSLKPVALKLKEILKQPLKFSPEHEPLKVLNEVSKLKNGEILMLENLRFNSGELKNETLFAKQLASLADLYVNDAFSVSHRSQASVDAIKKYLPSYAGLLMEKELEALAKILKPKKPFIAIMGGAKISTKAPLIEKFLTKAEKILIGGALATTFVKEMGFEVGKSLYDKDSAKIITKLFKIKGAAEKISLPIDFVVLTRDGKAKVVRPDEVKKSESILDIGPETIGIFAEYIKSASTLVWNGPMGKFEDGRFKQGSLSLARLVATRSKGRAYGLVGGGETVAVLKMTKMEEYVDFVSTAGGAMLSYLGGEKMPGLKKIVK
ncbi:phosphoglycerate kinase [Candidatus Falkowbacteria bacterium]|nr:phosphoglycerate kinase [Candidatus Falkowbacteria bacterium]